MRTLTIEALSKAAFAPFGDVIETQGSTHFLINSGSTQRFDRLADVQLGTAQDQAVISIFRAQTLPMPLTVRMLERHPLGSQAFIPLQGKTFLIVVAPAGEVPHSAAVRAFRSDGHQGINYHQGVWHHPILALADGDDFLVVDRKGPGNNCDEFFFEERDLLSLDPLR